MGNSKLPDDPDHVKLLIDGIRLWQENVIDLDAVVDDCRRDVEAAMATLQEAIRQRDHAARYLAHLITVHGAVRD